MIDSDNRQKRAPPPSGTNKWTGWRATQPECRQVRGTGAQIRFMSLKEK